MDDLASASSTIARRAWCDTPPVTVAIPFEYSGAWAAQTSFLRAVAVSMHRARHQHGRVLVLNLSGEQGVRALPSDVREISVSVERGVWHDHAARHALLGSLEIDCVLSLFGLAPVVEGIGLVGWIADFQHFRIPGNFSETEIRARDAHFNDMIMRCDRVVLSSRDAERDCIEFNAASKSKARVHSFPSGLIFESIPETTVTAKYHLPEKYALVANQFWAHKNHLTVIAAARQLAERGHHVPIVLTGLPADYRDPSNSLVSQVLQGIATGGLRSTVIPLGQVPYADLVALLRSAALIIQPSKFEGWSTTVQDAKALGRPLACSSIAVHREQAPEAIGFFDPTAAAELAALIERRWSQLAAGPNPESERVALAKERSFALDYGRALLQTCAEAST